MYWSLFGLTRNFPATAGQPSVSVESAYTAVASASPARGTVAGPGRAAGRSLGRVMRRSWGARGAAERVPSEEREPRSDVEDGQNEPGGDREQGRLTRRRKPCRGHQRDDRRLAEADTGRSRKYK